MKNRFSLTHRLIRITSVNGLRISKVLNIKVFKSLEHKGFDTTVGSIAFFVFLL